MNQKWKDEDKIKYLLANGWKKYSKEEVKKAEGTWAEVIVIAGDIYFKPRVEE